MLLEGSVMAAGQCLNTDIKRDPKDVEGFRGVDSGSRLAGAAIVLFSAAQSAGSKVNSNCQAKEKWFKWRMDVFLYLI